MSCSSWVISGSKRARKWMNLATACEALDALNWQWRLRFPPLQWTQPRFFPILFPADIHTGFASFHPMPIFFHSSSSPSSPLSSRNVSPSHLSGFRLNRSCYDSVLDMVWNPHSRCFSTRGFEGSINGNLEKILEKKIVEIETKYNKLQVDLMKENLSPENLGKLNKEINKLEKIVSEIRNFRSKEKEISELVEILNDSEQDKEIFDMAKIELENERKNFEVIQKNILLLLIPKDSDDQKNCILEVRAGTGGEEASLFAMDIFKMYERFAHINGWKFDIVEVNSSDIKGYKEAIASISGDGVYEKLKYESGVHRVQRVPVTEKSGRIHTSAASVVVLPEADELDVVIRNEDLRIDTYRSGGCGGQSVNTTNSAVRIVHIPTGTMVAIQDERSQHRNKAKALQILRARLYDLEKSKRANTVSELRQGQIGSGDRSERIRTYNFSQGRVTDHRMGLTLHNLELMLQGEGLHEVVDALLAYSEVKAIETLQSTV